MYGEVIAATHLLDGLPDARNPPYSQARTVLDRRLARKLKTYGIVDPPFKRGNAIPLGILQSIMATGASTSDLKTRHVANLVKLGFYFCLRSCKYTKCTVHCRTVQVRPLLEFVLFVGD